jgi:tellurite resistance protein
MVRKHTLAAVVALSAFVAACSGGSESSEPEKTAEESKITPQAEGGT